MQTKFKLTEGLGDCVIFAGVLEQYAKIHNLEYVEFCTSSHIVNLLKNNYTIKTTSVDDGSFMPIKWVSQLDRPDVYNLHTCQRFSLQLGFFADPIHTPNLGVYNKPKKKTVCINTLSNEPNRRFLSKDVVDLIEGVVKDWGWETVYIGNHWNKSITDIPTALQELEDTCLFIGPVSFWYHVAESLDTTCILCTGYMPPQKFSHFKNTVSIQSLNDRHPCQHECEINEESIRKEKGCSRFCYASADIDRSQLIIEINKALKIAKLDPRIR